LNGVVGRGWDAASPGWQKGIDEGKDWRKYPTDPSLAFSPSELVHVESTEGCDVCVLGSGDNLAVFALAGLGAHVTSVDISQTQLDIASQRAEELGLEINFVRADVTDLSDLKDERFDLVYTGGHVGVWVSDLEKYYAEAGRILRTDGTFVISEYHPFRRLWAENPDRMELEFRYFDRGPHQYDRSEETTEPGPLPSYEFHWTVSEYVTTMMNAGMQLVQMEEYCDNPQDWETAPLSGLPSNLFLVGRKL
jgi:ubiquinone/menaquinone biosynthesis C-methylase UbiE